MPFDDVADFAAGVCASAIKPANDASASPMKEALKKFMSVFVFRTSRHVQSHHYRLVFVIRITTRSPVGSAVGAHSDAGDWCCRHGRGDAGVSRSCWPNEL